MVGMARTANVGRLAPKVKPVAISRNAVMTGADGDKRMTTLRMIAAAAALFWAIAALAAGAVTINWPATIAAGQTWTSDPVTVGDGDVGIFGCATSTQAGTLSIQRYATRAGAIGIGSATSQVMSANTSACVAVNDGMPYLSFRVSITNSGGSPATISGTAAGRGPS